MYIHIYIYIYIIFLKHTHTQYRKSSTQKIIDTEAVRHVHFGLLLSRERRESSSRTLLLQSGITCHSCSSGEREGKARHEPKGAPLRCFAYVHGCYGIWLKEGRENSSRTVGSAWERHIAVAISHRGNVRGRKEVGAVSRHCLREAELIAEDGEAGPCRQRLTVIPLVG